MRTKEQAIAFLTSKEYLNPNKTIDMQTLAHILLQLRNTAPRVPKPITDRIRAVAFLLADAGTQQMANEITTMIRTQLNEHMETLTFSAESMHDTAEQVTKIMKDISGKMGELRDNFQEMVEQITQATQESAD